MKIITWNCNMAFRKKAAILLAHQPDVLVLQECECAEKLTHIPCLRFGLIVLMNQVSKQVQCKGEYPAFYCTGSKTSHVI